MNKGLSYTVGPTSELKSQTQRLAYHHHPTGTITRHFLVKHMLNPKQPRRLICIPMKRLSPSSGKTFPISSRRGISYDLTSGPCSMLRARFPFSSHRPRSFRGSSLLPRFGPKPPTCLPPLGSLLAPHVISRAHLSHPRDSPIMDIYFRCESFSDLLGAPLLRCATFPRDSMRKRKTRAFVFRFRAAGGGGS